MPAPVIPAGAPIWNDLTASDLDGAVRFYTTVFGWEYEDFGEQFGHYGQFTLHGAPVAGIGPTMAPGQPVVWTVYLKTPEIHDAVDQTVAAGGQVIAAPMDIMGKGFMAVVVDPAGAAVGFWQPGTFGGFEVVAEANAPAWHELLTKDYARAVEYYSGTLGWDITVQGDSDEFRYCIYQTAGSDPHAGIMDASGFLPDAVPSHWSVYFAVDDPDAVIARALELGATTAQGPEDTPFGRMATLIDPQGAAFKLISMQDPQG